MFSLDVFNTLTLWLHIFLFCPYRNPHICIPCCAVKWMTQQRASYSSVHEKHFCAPSYMHKTRWDQCGWIPWASTRWETLPLCIISVKHLWLSTEELWSRQLYWRPLRFFFCFWHFIPKAMHSSLGILSACCVWCCW